MRDEGLATPASSAVGSGTGNRTSMEVGIPYQYIFARTKLCIHARDEFTATSLKIVKVLNMTV